MAGTADRYFTEPAYRLTQLAARAVGRHGDDPKARVARMRDQKRPWFRRRHLSIERLRRLIAARAPVIWTQHSSLIVLGIVSGIGGGLGAVAFRWLIQVFHALFFDAGGAAFSSLGPFYTVVLPALGGAIVGPLTVFLAPEARGHGVPEIMQAVATQGGRIRPRVAVIKALASSVCIGSGGSVGREGPIAQIGAALGSMLGMRLGLPEKRLKTLVACGAAGGIAATFNAPIGGAFFALELILGEWSAEAFAPVVIATVIAASTGRTVFGDAPAFAVPDYHMRGPHELPYFILLGLVTGAVAVVFIRAITATESAFDRIPVPRYLLPVIGGLVVGVIGLHDSTLYGVGYGKIQELLTAPQALIWPLLILIALKLLAASVTLGSGGSGGVFSPSLYIGALVGCVFGVFADSYLPGAPTVPAAYALVGMAAVFAGASHAPVTAILIVFELTADYHMILPLLLAVGTSVLTARLICRFSIYNIKLVRHGVHVQLGHDIQVLSEVSVADTMTRRVDTLPVDAPVSEIMAVFERTRHHSLPVTDDQGRLCGLVTLSDVERAGPDARNKTACEIASHRLAIAFPDDSLNDALRKMGIAGVGHLPVVDPDDHARLLGIITRQDIVSAYKRALMRLHTHLEETQDEDYFH